MGEAWLLTSNVQWTGSNTGMYVQEGERFEQCLRPMTLNVSMVFRDS